MGVVAVFTPEAYRTRIKNRQEEQQMWGVERPIITELQLMHLDMDVIMSACLAGMKIIVYTNEKESPRWLKLMETCPFARKLCTVPSNMGDYTVTQWLMSKEDYRV
jgi:hypothetical protein